MAREILMPALTPTMEEGTLARWHVRPGDAVEPGQVIAEIETDKSVLELEALEGGEIGELMVEEGAEGVAVDCVIATLLEPGAASAPEADEPLASTERPDGGGPPGVGPAEPGSSPQPQSQVSASTPAIPSPQPLSQVSVSTGAMPSPEGRPVRVPASPAARRLAREHSIDISALKGTGPSGRIIAADIEAALADSAPAGGALKHTEKDISMQVSSSADGSWGVPATATAPVSGVDIPFEERPLSTLGKTIARRMAESKTTIPHFHCSIDVNVDAALRRRAALNAVEGGPRLSLNDFVVHAVARALRDTPRMNVQYRDDRLIRFRRVDIAVAVAVEEGLVTPVVRGAEALSLSDLASALRVLAERARAMKLSVEDYQGGTFTVSNVGMFGIRQSWPIINPPHAGILGVGAATPRPVAIDDGGGVRVEVATMMSLTLAADHRAVDGVIAGEFLRRVKEALETTL